MAAGWFPLAAFSFFPCCLGCWFASSVPSHLAGSVDLPVGLLVPAALVAGLPLRFLPSWLFRALYGWFAVDFYPVSCTPLWLLFGDLWSFISLNLIGLVGGAMAVWFPYGLPINITCFVMLRVKIIKCLVENIVVDISFNQVGGLCTLCFLDEIDHLINQNHLFKRSIILIKAWCYYESRILGAHHGLISTYALETLVLYIFHVFNNSFNGPLEVLFRFLEFFSHFDWDNFCVSLWGPVPISSLPDMSAESPRKDGGELLLSGLFLEACSSVYAVFPSGQENQGQQFVSKHFNVIDPLRTNNNLGRSVSKVAVICCSIYEAAIKFFFYDNITNVHANGSMKIFRTGSNAIIGVSSNLL
ncbi:hypothetical protein IEQ34_007262 [Dendrobium chrysotoxum]|uniref:PAP/OAS1 substrate-binding-related domain-containing protein n=1 Tax=Dendrobium chrysotoxum TaxID=161865 RepID=A0AAV7H5T9_DENCH|nr:hypothetical protein IEQ34_007262 [Dendrobium chrysotoxum]